MMTSTLNTLPRPSLARQRAALLVRIHAERQATAQAGRLLANDLQAVERSRRSFQAGLQVVKASVVSAGVIWSLNTFSHQPRIGRAGRFFTIAISLLSTLRAMRRVSAFLIPLLQSPIPPIPPPQRQEQST